MSFFLLASLLALGAHAAPASSADPAPVSLYSQGMELRRLGDYTRAREAFARMEKENPQSGGALEGLTLVSIAQGRYEEALAYIARWEKVGNNGYIQTLKVRVLSKLGRRKEMAAALLSATEFDPSDIRSGRRLDSVLRDDAPGFFPSGRISKTLSQEGVGTPSVARIVYEGRSGGTRARASLGPGFSAIFGAEVSQTAQRNDSAGFTYFDILEQVYSWGLEARKGNHRASVQYGQSILSDNKANGVGRLNFSRVKAFGAVQVADDIELRAYGERAPFFLRGAGGNRFFALLREDSARLEAEAQRWGLGFLARGGIIDYSDHTTVHNASFAATKEGGSYLVGATAAHSYQEFFGAGPTGRLTIMPYNRVSVRGQTGTDGRWRLSASYGRSAYRDGNRKHDGDAGVRLWLPWTGPVGDIWGSYRFEIEDFLAGVEGYPSSDWRQHWGGIFWKRQWRSGPWLQLGYEHGYLIDARGSYQGNIYTADLEWYRRRSLSLTAQGRVSNTTLRDKSHSLGFQARWTF